MFIMTALQMALSGKSRANSSELVAYYRNSGHLGTHELFTPVADPIALPVLVVDGAVSISNTSRWIRKAERPEGQISEQRYVGFVDLGEIKIGLQV
jgi:hypothetical protein